MNFGILGAGNWGSVFAIMLLEKGHDVRLWEFDRKRAEYVARTRDNLPFLKGGKLPKEIMITADIEKVVDGVDFLILAIPAQGVADTVKKIPTDVPVLSLVKGFDVKRLKRISQILAERIDEGLIAVLSGPSIANEVRVHNPTSVVVASTNKDLAFKLQGEISSDYFRIYRSDDVVGVEVGGIYKNTIAIACGIVDGLGFGSNAKAALISRGLREMMRFAQSLGAMQVTIYGLAGLGDMITTAFSTHSRNRRLGELVGKGTRPEEAVEDMIMIAEGFYSTPVLLALSDKLQVEIPIARAVDSVLYHGYKPIQAVEDLMLRPLKSEGE